MQKGVSPTGSTMLAGLSWDLKADLGSLLMNPGPTDQESSGLVPMGSQGGRFLPSRRRRRGALGAIVCNQLPW